MTWLRGRASARGIVLVAAAFTVQATAGCLSNEYRVERNELRRLATVPPPTRGEGVRVSQQLGERRGDALTPTEADVRDSAASVMVEGQAGSAWDGSLCCEGVGDLVVVPGSPGRPAAAGGWRGAPGGSGQPPGVTRPPSSGPAPSGSPAASGGWRGSPGSNGFRGAPAAGGFHGAPSPGASGASGAFSTVADATGQLARGGEGGGDKGGAVVALAVVAVVVVVSAAVATLALAASEGARFEGHVRVAPTQIVHLTGQAGGLDVPLAELTPQQVAQFDSALVMDDEGYGMLRLDHAPLDRHGPLFRFELGEGVYTFQGARAVGLTSHIQAGWFLTRSFGLVADLGLGSGSLTKSCCVGAAYGADSLSRHSLSLEAQALPVGFGPLHLGGFAGVGVAFVGSGDAWWSGPVGGAGALVELDVTSHLALTLRGGASAADLPGGWSSAGTLTGGLTIY